MLRTVLALALMTSLLVGCQATAPGPNPVALVTDSWCSSHRAPRLTAAQIAVMSHEQKAAAVAELDYGEAHCGWRP